MCIACDLCYRNVSVLSVAVLCFLVVLLMRFFAAAVIWLIVVLTAISSLGFTTYVRLITSYVFFSVSRHKHETSYLIPRVSNYCLREWQDILSNCVNNKLYAIYQTVGTVGHNRSLSRHESVIINRLRIGHTHLTHSYLLSGDNQPTCSTCGHPLTVHQSLQD